MSQEISSSENLHIPRTFIPPPLYSVVNQKFVNKIKYIILTKSLLDSSLGKGVISHSVHCCQFTQSSKDNRLANRKFKRKLYFNKKAS
jgi:hypothetical protein